MQILDISRGIMSKLTFKNVIAHFEIWLQNALFTKKNSTKRVQRVSKVFEIKIKTANILVCTFPKCTNNFFPFPRKSIVTHNFFEKCFFILKK